jgi:hypothetical protein
MDKFKEIAGKITDIKGSTFFIGKMEQSLFG